MSVVAVASGTSVDAVDVAAAGIAPRFDAAWLTADSGGSQILEHAERVAGYGYPQGDRVALNLGGIANVTVVGGAGDDDGRLAASGRVRRELLDRLLGHPYFRLSQPKSTGRETFSVQFLDAALADVDPVDGPDLLATLTWCGVPGVAPGVDGATTGAVAPRSLGRIALPSDAPRPPQPRPDLLHSLSVLPIGTAA